MEWKDLVKVEKKAAKSVRGTLLTTHVSQTPPSGVQITVTPYQGSAERG